MKISKYITKYDYIAYYTKQPSMWFYTNTEIDTLYKTEYQLHSHNSNIEIDEEDDDEFDENESIDSYSIYRELLSESTDVDKNNYLIVEGLLIDQLSKKYIIEYFQKEYGNLLNVEFKIVDFDDEKLNIENNIEKTKNLIFHNSYLILFQPAFIDAGLNTVTKCDALVKINNDIFIIETKATSTAKFHHILDLFFQKKVVEKTLSQFNISYRLCLIKYEKQIKKHVSFIISETINLKKSVDASKKVDLDTKQCIKLAKTYQIKNKVYPNVFIDDILDLNYEILQDCLKEDKINVINDLFAEYLRVINQLWEQKRIVENSVMPSELIPHKNDKNIFKNTDMWQLLRKLYFLKGYIIFGYSGNIIDFSSANLTEIANLGPNIKYDFTPFLRYINSKTGNAAEKNINRLFTNNDQFRIYKDNFNKLMSNLKDKKVYFDFESINPCIRVIDNSLPFTQIVTQNSVIIDHNNGLENLVCNNMMIDPNNVDINWFKAIIDSLFQGEEYSYVVYNKNFESKRLEEMAEFINENEYYNKVSVINANMFDLADFFMFKKNGDTIIVKELNGFYSIKCVLPLVEKYAPEIFQKTKCKNYKTLEISNGLICQQNTLARFYGSLDDNKWNTIVNNSKIYCENDVRAMIAVEYFIKEYIAKKANYVD